MTEEMKLTSSTTNVSGLTKLREVCGPPPVLSSENMKAYDEMLARLMKCMAPQDLFRRKGIADAHEQGWALGVSQEIEPRALLAWLSQFGGPSLISMRLPARFFCKPLTLRTPSFY